MQKDVMDTEVVPLNPDAPDAERIARAAEILRNGGLVAFPTETVYGLGANGLDRTAVQRIYRAKGRPSNNPLILHVPDLASARALVTAWPEQAAQLAEHFWPGPLTLVLPKCARVPDAATGGGPTVALRVPANPIALALLRAAPFPLAAPSANRSQQLSPTLAQHVARDLGGRIQMILDGGPTTGGVESTVLNLTTNPPRLLRPGLVTPAQIEAVIGPILRPDGSPVPVGGDALPSPGMQTRHYAPRAPLQIVDAETGERVIAKLMPGEPIGWLRFTPRPEAPDLRIVRMPVEPAAYAALLYATLHALDAAGVTRILVEAPPDGEDWLAVRDRLTRASAPE